MPESHSEAEIDLALARSPGSRLSLGGERGKLTILLYYRVLKAPDEMGALIDVQSLSPAMRE